MKLRVNLNELNIGGYCFGDRVYIQSKLRECVDGNIMVMKAVKIGLDVKSSALVILYNGNNITDHLVEILIQERMVTKSDKNQLIFLDEANYVEWRLEDLDAKDRVSLELHQNINRLRDIIIYCLQNCDSFKGNANDITIVDRAYDPYWDWREDKYFCIFHGERNITISLIAKLQSINLLYEKCGEYMLLTDSSADIGWEYHAGKTVDEFFSRIFPLILLSVILWYFFGKALALLVFVGGITFVSVSKRLSNGTQRRRMKWQYIEDVLFFVTKWIVILCVSTPISISLFGAAGILVSIGLIIFAIIKYRRDFRK